MVNTSKGIETVSSSCLPETIYGSKRSCISFEKKGYFVVALRLSHGFQSCRDIATTSCWTLHTGARCLIVLKEKKKFPIIYDNFDKDNYQKMISLVNHKRHTSSVVVVMFGHPCICFLHEKFCGHYVSSLHGPPGCQIQI